MGAIAASAWKVRGGYEPPDLDAMHADENTNAAQH